MLLKKYTEITTLVVIIRVRALYSNRSSQSSHNWRSGKQNYHNNLLLKPGKTHPTTCRILRFSLPYAPLSLFDISTHVHYFTDP